MLKSFIWIFILMVGYTSHLTAQDPHFSQFFMAPQFINPSIVGTSSGDWRMTSNWRRQWGNAGTPFNTQVLGGEYKLTGKDRAEFQEVEDPLKNTLAIGSAFMFDQSMNGSFRSTYATGSFAYHAKLSNKTRIGLGLHGMYGSRRIDYNGLVFGEQFTSGGFDATLPSGETALLNAKPFFSLGAGILFTYKNDFLNVDFGASAFHLNKPKQTFISDPNWIIPERYVGHLNIDYGATKTIILGFNAVYQQQSIISYFSAGGTIGIDISNGDRKHILYSGAWYREGDSFYPYFGFMTGNLQMGFSYDITHSKQNQGPTIPRSYEVSLVIKQKKKSINQLDCSPWK